MLLTTRSESRAGCLGRLYTLAEGVLRFGVLGGTLRTFPRTVQSFTVDDTYAYAIVEEPDGGGRHVERIDPSGKAEVLTDSSYFGRGIEVSGEWLVYGGGKRIQWSCKHRREVLSEGAPDRTVSSPRSPRGRRWLRVRDDGDDDRTLYRHDLPAATVSGPRAYDMLDFIVLGDALYSLAWSTASTKVGALRVTPR